MRTVVSAFVEMFLVIIYLTSNDLIRQPSSHLAQKSTMDTRINSLKILNKHAQLMDYWMTADTRMYVITCSLYRSIQLCKRGKAGY